jgi:hypothetical protein
MNTGLQLDITEPARGVLKLAFPGRSVATDTNHLTAAIESELRQRTGIRKVVFDLSEVDPINNTAGRVLDLARGYSKQRRLKVELHIPRNVYIDLGSSDPLPKPDRKGKASLEGIELIITRPVKQSAFFEHRALVNRAALLRAFTTAAKTSPQKPANTATSTPQTVLECDGTVRTIQDDHVRVSLFTKDGEVVGDLRKEQFPSGIPRAGSMFRYKAIVSSPGTTEITIAVMPERTITADDILDLWQQAKTMVPSEEF